MKAGRSLVAGEEMFNTYGKKSNRHLYEAYGFFFPRAGSFEGINLTLGAGPEEWQRTPLLLDDKDGHITPRGLGRTMDAVSQAGLSQHEVASALAAANVTFSTLGSLCGPLVAGALVPRVFDFKDVTSVQAGFTAVCYLPALYLLGRYRPGPRPKPCGAWWRATDRTERPPATYRMRSRPITRCSLV